MTDSAFSGIIGQQRAIEILWTILARNKVPHALLFTGIDGIGKGTTALAFGAALNCRGERPPCGRCRSCKKIEAGSHPDIHRVMPAKTGIKVDQIRDLCASLSMKPYEARTRVVIIEDAQSMNPEAANAFLKVLEEPPNRTVMILTAIQTTDLLPTVVSRCQQVRFRPIPERVLERYLHEKKGFSEKAAMVSALLAGGSVGRAIGEKDSLRMERRGWLLSELSSLSNRPLPVILSFAERLSKEKSDLDEVFAIIRMWLRDLLICRYDPNRIKNRDWGRDVRKSAKGFSQARLLSDMAALNRAQKEISANANPRMALEGLLMQLAGRGSSPCAARKAPG